MYEYKFERLEATDLTWSGYEVGEAQYQNVIRQHAADGWRLVQIFAPPLTAHGRPKHYELIFERETR